MKQGIFRSGLGLTLVMVIGLSGCSTYDDVFGEEEEKLPGDRIALRRVNDDRPADPQTAARLTPLPPMVANADWSHVNVTPSHSGGHLAGPAGFTVAWRADAGSASDDSNPITSRPIVFGGSVYALDAEAKVTALDARSGAVRWRVSLAPEGEYASDGFGGGLSGAGGRIYATTGFGELVALSTVSGEIAWRTALGAPVRAAPTVLGEVIGVVTRDNVAYGIDAATGRIGWRVQGASGGASALGGASPAASGDVMVVPFASGEVVAVQASTGRQAWSNALTGGRRGLARASITDITSDPVILGTAVFAGNQSGLLAAFDGQSGARAWVRSLGSLNPVWPVGETLYVLTDDARLVRLAAQSGLTLWSRDLPAYEDPDDRDDAIAYGGPVVAGGRVLVTSSTGKFLSFDPETGSPQNEVSLGSGATTGPIVAGGLIYVLTDDGDLIAFR